MISEKEIYAFCRGHYYCDDKGEEEGEVLCEAWEDSSEEDVEEQIQSDVKSLKEFESIQDNEEKKPSEDLSKVSDEELSALHEEARQSLEDIQHEEMYRDGTLEREE